MGPGILRLAPLAALMLVLSGGAVAASGDPGGGRISSTVPNDPLFTALWALDQASDRDVDAPEAWSLQTGRASVVVAVIDSGVAYDHPDLAANVWTNDDPPGGGDEDDNGFEDDTHGWDFVEDDNAPLDFDGHGTHLAGTIGAKGNNALGIVGVNWDVSIMPLRAGFTGWGLANLDVAAAIAYACAEGAKVVTGSFGGAVSDVFVRAEITSARCAKTLFAVPAGDDGRDLTAGGVLTDSFPCELHRPAAGGGVGAPNVVCVGATDQTDAPAGFSNYGAPAVHLAAPGVGIQSAAPAWSQVPGTEEGFEGTDGEFDARWGDRSSSPGNAEWGRTSAVKASGAFALADSPAGDYAPNSDTTIRRLGPYDLSGRSGCAADYALRLDTEAGFDPFEIWVGGTTETETRAAERSGSTGGEFRLVRDDVSPLDGLASGYLRFALFSDGDANGDGAYVDDLALSCLTAAANAYETVAGTSIAAAHVAGAAALLLAENPLLTPAQLKSLLLGGVDTVAGLAGVVSTGGRLNVHKALLAVPVPDTTRPTTTITGGPKGTVKAKSATFKFKSNEAGSTFQCKLDKQAFKTCKSGVRYTKLKKGAHTFQVLARDKAGNVDATPAKRSWKVK